MNHQRVFAGITILLATVVLSQSSLGDDVKPAGDPKLPTLWIIGDSTVNNHGKGLLGWGDPIGDWFDRSTINVVNRARGGRSSRTFLTEGLWDAVLKDMKRGDFVLMQFGHNDSGSLADPKNRASIHGAGEETQDVLNPTTGQKEIVHTYGWYMRKYVKDAEARGAAPIVLSPVPRNMWKEDRVLRAAGDYGKWAAEVAKGEGAAFIDLNEIIAKKYDAAGEKKVAQDYFTSADHTHTTAAGAKLNAACVVDGIRELKDCALGKYLFSEPAARTTSGQ
jgi:lysophospholipase L1-like esterase